MVCECWRQAPDRADLNQGSPSSPYSHPVENQVQSKVEKWHSDKKRAQAELAEAYASFKLAEGPEATTAAKIKVSAAKKTLAELGDTAPDSHGDAITSEGQQTLEAPSSIQGEILIGTPKASMPLSPSTKSPHKQQSRKKRVNPRQMTGKELHLAAVYNVSNTT